MSSSFTLCGGSRNCETTGVNVCEIVVISLYDDDEVGVLGAKAMADVR